MAAVAATGALWQDLRPGAPACQRLGCYSGDGEPGAGAAAEARRLLCTSFSQDGSQFVVGTTAGLAVYSTSPVEVVRPWQSLPGACAGGGCRVLVAATLFRSSILAVVVVDAAGRGGDRAQLWDVARGAALGELRAGPKDVVRGVLLRRDLFALVCERFVRLYAASSLLPKLHVATAANPHGLCALTGAGDTVLCCPGEAVGEVLVLQGLGDAGRRSFRAHDRPLRQLLLAQEGSLVLTASEYGTIVKIFCPSGRLLHSVRLANTPTTVTALAWSADARLAGVAFEGTPCVYLFRAGAEGPEAAAPDEEEAARPTKAGILPNFCAYVRLPDVDSSGRPQADVRDADLARVHGPQLVFYGTSLHILNYDGFIHEVSLREVLAAKSGAPRKELRCARSAMYLAPRAGWAFAAPAEQRQEDTEGSDWELLS